jgi:predicted nucleic acid-binding protein
MSEYVVDTCILVKANHSEPKEAFPFLELLIRISSEHGMCLDTEREILKEYGENVYKGFSGEWFKNMQRAGKIRYVKKTIRRNQRQDLIKLKFDPNDIKFVATAYVCGKKIVSDDSDYNNTVTAYLLEKMGIRVFQVNSSLF